MCLIGLAALYAGAASAHVKWFAGYDVPAQPKLLSQVVSRQFLALTGLGFFIFFLACAVERTPIGHSINKGLDKLSLMFMYRVDDLYRAGTAVFFVAVPLLGGTILTPELKTAHTHIALYQIAIAIGLFWRPTMILSAIGIVVLYIYGVREYGFFHMLDYPIFLGLAAYLFLSGLGRNFRNIRPLDISRWLAGITLIWASVEKWAYPGWTYPVLVTEPEIAFGFPPGLYMNAAGVIEFTCAFGLLWTPMIRRLSAIALLFVFISAIAPFGKVDAVGHLMIIIILIGILIDDKPNKPLPVWLSVVGLAAVLAIDLLLYYGLHALRYHTMMF
ncbi:MAG: hypothetical protein QM537_04735 [Candidatus Symbiobacter sp.]|nr:hypothetical protein [Candidatus Symbiobacter sp.]